MKKFLFILFGIILFVSCNVHVEKRLYRKGYYVEVTPNSHRTVINKNNLVSNHDEMASTHKPVVETNDNNKILIPNENVFPSGDLQPDNVTVASANNNIDLVSIYKVPSTRFNVINSNEESGITMQDKSDDAKVETIETAEANKNGDANLYLLTLLMASVVIAVFKFSQSLSLKIGRWAKKNKVITKVIMTLLQMKIGVMGILTGKELFEMGYSFSDSMEYVFGGLMLIPFLYLLLSKPKDEVMVMKSYYLRKLSVLGLVLPFYMLTVAIGNKLEDERAQISPLGIIVQKTYYSIAGNKGTTFNVKHVPVLRKNIVPATEVNTNPVEDSRGGCDVITLTDNTTMEVLIESANNKQVKYKKCNNPDGPTYVTPSKKVAKIVKSNGDIIEGKDLPEKERTGWPGWYIAVYIIMTLLLVCAIVVSWIFLSYTPAAPIAITIVCLALIIGVPFLMQRRVKLGNIKRREKKKK